MTLNIDLSISTKAFFGIASKSENHAIQSQCFYVRSMCSSYSDDLNNATQTLESQIVKYVPVPSPGKRFDVPFNLLTKWKFECNVFVGKSVNENKCFILCPDS